MFVYLIQINPATTKNLRKTFLNKNLSRKPSNRTQPTIKSDLPFYPKADTPHKIDVTIISPAAKSNNIQKYVLIAPYLNDPEYAPTSAGIQTFTLKQIA